MPAQAAGTRLPSCHQAAPRHVALGLRPPSACGSTSPARPRPSSPSPAARRFLGQEAECLAASGATTAGGTGGASTGSGRRSTSSSGQRPSVAATGEAKHRSLSISAAVGVVGTTSKDFAVSRGGDRPARGSQTLAGACGIAAAGGTPATAVAGRGPVRAPPPTSPGLAAAAASASVGIGGRKQDFNPSFGRSLLRASLTRGTSPVAQMELPSRTPSACSSISRSSRRPSKQELSGDSLSRTASKTSLSESTQAPTSLMSTSALLSTASSTLLPAMPGIEAEEPRRRRDDEGAARGKRRKEEEDVKTDAVQAVSSPTETKAKRPRPPLPPGLRQAFAPYRWLSDDAISYAYSRISEADGDTCSDTAGKLSEDVLLIDPPTAFWLAMQTEDKDRDEARQALKVLDRRLVLCPINDNHDGGVADGGTHWALLVWDRQGIDAAGSNSSNLSESKAGRFIYYDSGFCHMPKCEDQARQLAKRLAGGDVPLQVGQCPKQTNSFDCGMYVIVFTELIVKSFLASPRRSRGSSGGGDNVTPAWESRASTVTPKEVADRRASFFRTLSSMSAAAAAGA